jgi:predicted ATPase
MSIGPGPRRIADSALLVQGLQPESDYRFKHALIQDAAYENLLKSRRQVLHRRAAEALRDNAAAAEPELLAHHARSRLLVHYRRSPGNCGRR